MPRGPLGPALLPGMAAALLCLRSHLPAAAWHVPAWLSLMCLPQALHWHPPAGSCSSPWLLLGQTLPACVCSAVLPASALLPGTVRGPTARGPAHPKGSLFLLLLQPCLPLLAFLPLAFLLLSLCCLFSLVSLPYVLLPGCPDVLSPGSLQPKPPLPLPGRLSRSPFPLLTAVLTPWDYFSFSPCLVAFGS